MKIRKRALQRVILEELKFSRRTGLKLTPRRLLDALYQRGYLLEGDEEQQVSLDHEETGASLDEQVDRYLSQYEKNAKSSGPMEGIDWRSDVRRFLTEAEGDEEEPPPDEEGGEDAAPEVEAPTKLGVNDIDVEDFANNVGRLVDNYDSLLEVRSTLVRRAINFVAETYDDEVVRLLKSSLREQHGLVPGVSKDELDAEEFKAPRAGEAGPGGGAA